jgi:hypothetical protein
VIATPFQLWTLGLRTGVMLAEAQTVIVLRLWGMAGLWPVSPSETTRMVAEKWPAFLHAAGAAGAAAMKGQEPHRIASAALRPIAKKTRANSRRLARGTRRRKS